MTKNVPTDGAAQKLVPTSLRTYNLYYYSYPRLAGHQGEGRVYDSTKRKYYWPQIAKHVCKTVKHCHGNAQTSQAVDADAPYIHIRRMVQ